MRLLTTPLAAALLFVCVGSASARCPLYLPMRVGPTTGNPERDTIGLFCVQPELGAPASSPGAGRSVTRVGAPMGDAEKDTVGFAPSSGTEQAAR